jgi:hypothetical protein
MCGGPSFQRNFSMRLLCQSISLAFRTQSDTPPIHPFRWESYPNYRRRQGFALDAVMFDKVAHGTIALLTHTPPN